MSDDVRLAGDRDVRVSIDAPDADHAVVACPPHPQMGGNRRDARLRAVGDALAEAGIACLRFDYGSWDEGRGEQRDARNVIAHARDRYERVGLFGYSFGAGIAMLVADDLDPETAALSVLAPPASIGSDFEVTAVRDLECPVQVVYGERDSTVDWESVVAIAEEEGWDVEGVESDHFFVGQTEKIGTRVCEFFSPEL